MCVCYDTVSGWGWNAKGLKWIGADDDSATRGVRCCVCGCAESFVTCHRDPLSKRYPFVN